MFSGLGGQPSAEKASTNVFGTSQSFGSPTTTGTGKYDVMVRVDGSGGSTYCILYVRNMVLPLSKNNVCSSFCMRLLNYDF